MYCTKQNGYIPEISGHKTLMLRFYIDAHTYDGESLVEEDLIRSWGPFSSYCTCLRAARVVRNDLDEFQGYVVLDGPFDEPPWDSADGPLWEEGDSVMLSIRREREDIQTSNAYHKYDTAKHNLQQLVGQRVKLCNLVRQPWYNGLEAQCLGFCKDSSRAVIKVKTKQKSFDRDHRQLLETNRNVLTRRKRFAVSLKNIEIDGVCLDFAMIDSGDKNNDESHKKSREVLSVLFTSLLPRCRKVDGNIDERKIRRLMEQAIEHASGYQQHCSDGSTVTSPSSCVSFQELKTAEATMIAKIIERETFGEVRGLGLDIGSGVHGIGPMIWASRWHRSMKIYPTDYSTTLKHSFSEQCQDAAKKMKKEATKKSSTGCMTKELEAIALDSRAQALSGLALRWLRLDVEEDEVTWNTSQDGTQLIKLKGRMAVVTCVDLLSGLKAGDISAGYIRKPDIILAILRCFAIFLRRPKSIRGTKGGVGIWLDRGFADKNHFGRVPLRHLLPKIARMYGLSAVECQREVLLRESAEENAEELSENVQNSKRFTSDPCFVIRWVKHPTKLKNTTSDEYLTSGHVYSSPDTIESAKAWQIVESSLRGMVTDDLLGGTETYDEDQSH